MFGGFDLLGCPLEVKVLIESPGIFIGACGSESFLFLFVLVVLFKGLLLLLRINEAFVLSGGAGSGAEIRRCVSYSCSSSEDDELLPIVAGPLCPLLGAATDLDFLFAVFAEPKCLKARFLLRSFEVVVGFCEYIFLTRGASKSLMSVTFSLK